MEKQSIGGRIKWLIAEKGYSQNAFARESGIAVRAVNSVINGKNNPDFKFIQALLRQVPDVSRDWIILGEGEPFVNTNNVTYKVVDHEPTYMVAEEPIERYSKSAADLLGEELAWMKKQSIELTSQVKRLQHT